MTGALRPPTAPTLPVQVPDPGTLVEAGGLARSAAARIDAALLAARNGQREAARRNLCDAAELLQRAGIALGTTSGGPTDGGTVGDTEAVRKTP